MRYRYQCSITGYKNSYISNDTEIICQLPETLQCEYPGYMTHRSGLSKTLGDLYRPCVQNSVGAKRFHKIIREIHYLKHARLHLQYIQDICRRFLQPTIADVIQNQKKITPFFSFNVRSKYAGHVPSPQYFCSYTAFMEK